jgi:hypothetical protein
MTDQEKTELGLRTFEAFFAQFGNDIHAQILLEELLKGLIYEEALFIFGRQIQAGDEVGNSASERVDSDLSTEGSVEPEPAGDVAASDSTDYLRQPDAL